MVEDNTRYEYILNNFKKGKAFVKINQVNDNGIRCIKNFCIDRKGKIIYSLSPELQVQGLEYEDEDVAIVSYNDKSALIDNRGVFLTDLIYDHIYSGAENGLFEVRRSGLHGHIDIRGKEVIPCMYQTGHYFSEGVVAEKLNDKWGMIDYYNNTVIPFEYEEVGACFNNLITVKKNGKWGLIDKSNTLIVDYLYDNIYNFVTRDCVVLSARKGDKFGLIDRSGNIVEDFIYETDPFLVDCDGIEGEVLALRKDGKYALYSATEAKFLTDFIYNYVEYALEGMFKVSIDDKEGYVDRYGNVKIPAIYDLGFYFSEGVVGVMKGEYYGLVDSNNHNVIPFEYKTPIEVSNGMVLVLNDNYDFSYIDRSNNLVIPYGKYMHCKEFRNGYAVVYSKEKGHNIYINTACEEIDPINLGVLKV